MNRPITPPSPKPQHIKDLEQKLKAEGKIAGARASHNFAGNHSLPINQGSGLGEFSERRREAEEGSAQLRDACLAYFAKHHPRAGA